MQTHAAYQFSSGQKGSLQQNTGNSCAEAFVTGSWQGTWSGREVCWWGASLWIPLHLTLNINAGSFMRLHLHVRLFPWARWKSLQGELVPVQKTHSTSANSQLEAQLLRLQSWDSFLWDSLSSPGMIMVTFVLVWVLSRNNWFAWTLRRYTTLSFFFYVFFGWCLLFFKEVATSQTCQTNPLLPLIL